MAYGLIAVIASTFLALWYVFATEAPLWLKALIAGLFVASFSFHSLNGTFLKVGVGVFVLLYLRYVKALS
jgi:hypothetical protein